MLGDRMSDELGYYPRAVWHWLWWAIPGLNQVVTGLGGLRGAPTSHEIDDLKARGEHLVVAPGGMREAMRPFWVDGRVDLGDRRGYLRLALRYDLPIIPVVATGLDATFVGLNDGYRTSQCVFHRGDLPHGSRSARAGSGRSRSRFRPDPPAHRRADPARTLPRAATRIASNTPTTVDRHPASMLDDLRG